LLVTGYRFPQPRQIKNKTKELPKLFQKLLTIGHSQNRRCSSPHLVRQTNFRGGGRAWSEGGLRAAARKPPSSFAAAGFSGCCCGVEICC